MTTDALAPLPGDAQARFDAKVAEILDRRRDDAGRRALWRTHHHPDQYERCTVVAGRHVCRRCATLYPVAFLVAGLTIAGWSPWPERLDLWVIWLACLPATVDFIGEQLGWFRYSARRQFAVTLVLAPALGRGIGHELQDSWSWEMWGPVLVFCTLWFVVAVAGFVRRQGNGDDG